MCGIAGIVKYNNLPVDSSEIRKMTDLIQHRGPDDHGYYHGACFAFGHRRLAIIDLSHDGHQPMSDGRGNVIVYNGEVYNYIEIREELTLKGYAFSSKSDTEVILSAYAEWGPECVNKFNGMWAFAIYDADRQHIFCSRDRFGVKPFYFCESAGKFLFASEIKQLLAFGDRPTVNISLVVDYLVAGLDEHTSETFFTGIFKLPQSHNLLYDLKTHKYLINSYYELKSYKHCASLNESEAIDLYRDEFLRSVKIRLRSDVKVGTCLSGGLDSSTVAAFASDLNQPQTGNRLSAITASSLDPNTDESEYAKIVVEKLGLDWNVVTPTQQDFINALDEVIKTQEEPFCSPSIFMQYFVLKKAKEIGCIVMLDGQGGDETLLGYENYFKIILANHIISYSFTKALSLLVNIKSFKISRTRMLAQTLMYLFPSLRLKRIKCQKIVKPEYVDDFHLKNLFPVEDIVSHQINQIYRFNLPSLLRYEDKNSMRHSIETRLPYLDYRVVETALSVNNQIKFKNGYLKYLLRKTVGSKLPDEIVWRTNKFGFNSPTGNWFDGYRGAMKLEIEHSRIINKVVSSELKTFDDEMLWRLYNIAAWERLYHVECP